MTSNETVLGYRHARKLDRVEGKYWEREEALSHRNGKGGRRVGAGKGRPIHSARHGDLEPGPD